MLAIQDQNKIENISLLKVIKCTSEICEHHINHQTQHKVATITWQKKENKSTSHHIAKVYYVREHSGPKDDVI